MSVYRWKRRKAGMHIVTPPTGAINGKGRPQPSNRTGSVTNYASCGSAPGCQADIATGWPDRQPSPTLLAADTPLHLERSFSDIVPPYNYGGGPTNSPILRRGPAVTKQADVGVMLEGVQRREVVEESNCHCYPTYFSFRITDT
jgi:hypothetical protein